MKGWLITNYYLNNGKFSGIAKFIEESAKEYDIDLMHVTNADLLCNTKNSEFLNSEFEQKLPDFVLFFDKDYYLAKLLEKRGLKLYNSADSMLLCDDKALMHMNLAGTDIPVPDTVIIPKTFENIGYTKTEFLDNAANYLGLPFIIKESFGSFGEQVYLADSVSNAQKILEDMHGKSGILQKLVTESIGRDIRINIVGNKAVASMLRFSENGDFRANITAGGSAEPYTPNEEEEALAVRVCERLGLDFAGVDLLFGKSGSPVLCEVNSNPHFKSTFDVTDINVADKIFEYILGDLK